ncbi:MAG: DNA helicase RecQ [Eubacteriales bacterium]|nr:DNA helicase RecQ [Eubacteriales bacterium]
MSIEEQDECLWHHCRSGMENISNENKRQSLQILKKVFGYDSFRKGQEEIVESILNGQDVLGIMPTGAGKSICYQVPALMLKGITIVVSPLISLMLDQVKSLNEAGVHAAYINSALTETQISKALYNAMCGQYKIIYVAPERLETNRFLEFVMNADISMITVDEAHCISQWGQDFRPSYLKIVNLIKRLPKRPVVSAFTATATRTVKEDIVCILGLNSPNVMVTGFDRKNLYFEVRHSGTKDADVENYIRKHQTESGIIYCSTRKNVDNIYLSLKKCGFPVTRYHAGLSSEERKENQEDFIYDRKPIIVATNAFGMGIDKSNVRYVIHYNMPQCIENYYQEAGRAGRDGEPAECILLYSAQDVVINEFLIEHKGENTEFAEDELALIRENDIRRLNKMRYYCTTKNCLREYMLNYFGEYSTSQDCGNCSNCIAVYEDRNVTDICKRIIYCINECRGRYGANVIVGTLHGDRNAKLRSYNVDRLTSFGMCHDVNPALIKSAVEELVMREVVSETQDMYRLLRNTSQAVEITEGKTQIVIKWSLQKAEAKADKLRTRQKKSSMAFSPDTAEMALFEKLRGLRLKIAKEENMPPYIIFSDKTLVDMCVKRPSNRDEMLRVAGVGENKYQRYGQRFIEALKE